MNRVWHLTKFELRRHRWVALVLLASILVLPVLRSLMLESLVDPANFMARGLGLTLLLLCFFVTWFSVLAGIIQGEPASGSRAMWMTRPISGWRLLGSKLLAAAVLALGLPAFTQLVVMIVFGAPVLVAADAALGLVSILVVMALPALLLAALTRRLATFWGCVIAGIMALSIVIASRPLLGVSARSNLSSAQIAAGFIVLAIGALGLLGWLYRRRALAAVAWSAVGLVLVSAAVAMVWPWAYTPDTFANPLRATPVGSAVEVLKRPAQSTLMDRVRDQKRRRFTIGLRLDQWPNEQLWRLQRCTGAVRRPDGTELAAPVLARAAVAARQGLEPALAALLQRRIPASAFGSDLSASATFDGEFTQTDAAGVAGPGKFEGQARVDRVELRVVGIVSLKNGDAISLGAERLRIGEAELHADRVEARVAQERFARSFGSGSVEEFAMREPLLVLLHRDQVVRVIAARGSASTGAVGLPGWLTQFYRVSFPLPPGAPGADSPTLADFSVAVVIEVPREHCEVPVTFELPRVN